MRKLFLLAFLTATICSGCVTGAVNPFYTPETTTPSTEYEGRWVGLEKDAEGNDVRTPLEIQANRIVMDEGKHTGAIQFFIVDGQVFADLQLDGQSEHLLFKIIKEVDTLIFIPLDYVWLQAEIGAGNIDLPLVRDEDKRSTLFTASPQQWTEFIKAHRQNDYAFPLKEQFVLIRGN